MCGGTWTTFMPLKTRPKTVCLLSSHGVCTVAGERFPFHESTASCGGESRCEPQERVPMRPLRYVEQEYHATLNIGLHSWRNAHGMRKDSLELARQYF